MKMRHCIPLAAWLAAAQAFAITYETPEEISLVGDVTRDGVPDLIIVDRATGQVRVGQGDGSSVFTWQAARDTGMANATAAALGDFRGDSFDELLLASAEMNNGVLFSTDADWPAAVSLSGVEPTMLVDLPTSGAPGTTGKALTGAREALSFGIGIGLGGGGDTHAMVEIDDLSGGFGFSPPLNYGPLFVPAHGTRLPNVYSSARLVLWREVDRTNAAVSKLRVVGVTQSEFSQSLQELDDKALNGTNADYTVEQSTPGDYWVFTWHRGSTGFTYEPLTADFSGPQPSIGFYAHPFARQSFSSALPVDFVTLVRRTGDTPLIAVSMNNGSVVKLYNFDGSALTLLQSVTPDGGLNAAGLVPWGDAGNFALLTRSGISGPSTGVTRYGVNGGGQYESLGSDVLPALRKSVATNVFLWQGEPLVDPSSKLVGMRRAKDWATTVLVGAGVSATAESYVSSTTGLANASSVGVGSAAPGTTHATGNHLSDTMSIFSWSPPADPNAQAAAPTFSPSPGRYSGPSKTVTVRGSGFFGNVHYRVNGGAWSQFTLDGADPHADIIVTSDSVIEAYTSDFGTFGAPPKSRIVSAAYAIGAAPTQPSRGVDANGNGIADEWEKLFGITDPTADDDGDGQSNFAEFNAGTDPRNAQSFHTPAPTLPELRIGVVPQGAGWCICARWSHLDPSVRLEQSNTLGAGAAWTAVSDDAVTDDGTDRVFSTTPAPGANARFYRLARY